MQWQPKRQISAIHAALNKAVVTYIRQALDQRLATPPLRQELVRCCNADDQMFIDLAAARRARLLSKDALVLRLAKRLLPLGVVVSHTRG